MAAVVSLDDTLVLLGLPDDPGLGSGVDGALLSVSERVVMLAALRAKANVYGGRVGQALVHALNVGACPLDVAGAAGMSLEQVVVAVRQVGGLEVGARERLALACAEDQGSVRVPDLVVSFGSVGELPAAEDVGSVSCGGVRVSWWRRLLGWLR